MAKILSIGIPLGTAAVVLCILWLPLYEAAAAQPDRFVYWYVVLVGAALAGASVLAARALARCC